MSRDAADWTNNDLGSTWRCGHCGGPISQCQSVGKTVVYFCCARCLNDWRAAWAETPDDEAFSLAYHPSPVEVFRPGTPGSQPHELLMALPGEAWHRRQYNHRQYAYAKVPDPESADVAEDDEFLAARVAAEEREKADIERETLLQQLMILHQNGKECPACRGNAEEGRREPTPISLADPETLTLEALQEQYSALLEAHEQLRQEYEDLEVVYHATIKHHQQQDDEHNP